MPQELKEAIYTCTNPKCGKKQTITFFMDEPILPITCCTGCRAGFGVEFSMQLNQGLGMVPGKVTQVAA